MSVEQGLASLAMLCAACAPVATPAPRPAPSVEAVPAPLLQSSEPSVVTAPPPPAPPPPPPRRAFPDYRTPHDFCDVREIQYQASTPRDRLAALDELRQCIEVDGAPGVDPARLDELRRAYRQAMLEIAFVDGGINLEPSRRLVAASILGTADARAMVGARAAVRLLLRDPPSGARLRGPHTCRIRLDANALVLYCTARGPCGGGCGMRFFDRATIRIEGGRFQLVQRSYEASDEAHGTCGCCVF
jgi:hypothetical protein